MTFCLFHTTKYSAMLKRFYSLRSLANSYEMPERYRNSFYLANASFFNEINWFVHNAYEVGFNRIAERFEMSRAKVGEFVREIEQCNSMLDLRYPIERDNGQREIVRAYRAQHGLVFPNQDALGGLKLSPDVNRDNVKALSVHNTYKYACLDISLSGSFGGIRIDPKQYSENELKRIVEGYVQELHKKNYFQGDCFETEVNTEKNIYNWLKTNQSDHSPTILGRSEISEKAASRGTFLVLEFFMNHDKIANQLGLSTGLAQKTFIIEDVNTFSCQLGELLHNAGALCVGVKETDCCVYKTNGLDLKESFSNTFFKE